MAADGTKAVDEAARYRTVLPASTRLPCPPRFTFGDFPASVASSYYRATHLHGMGVYSGDKLAWGGGFVIDADGDFLVGADVHIHPQSVGALSPATKTQLHAAPVDHLSGKAAIISPPGNAYSIYGHWLVDMLPKLAVLEAAEHDWQSCWYPIPAGSPKFALELMKLFGIPADKIVQVADGRKIVADTLLMPTTLHNGVRFSPLLRDAVALFRRGVARFAVPDRDGPARVFLARNGGNRLLTNRARIEAMARSAGFTVVYPETLSLVQQVALFSSAREIAGEYGSAFHTAMFSPAGTTICGLRGGQIHPAFIQSGMGEELLQPTGYVFGKPEGNPAKFDYAIAEDVFADCLKTVFDRHTQIVRQPVAQPLHEPAASPPSDTLDQSSEKPSGLRRLRRWLSSKPPKPAPGTRMAPPPGIDALLKSAGTTPVVALTPARVEKHILLTMAHIRNKGDTLANADGWVGDGNALAIEGVRIAPGPGLPFDGFGYRVMMADGHLSEPVREGSYCGTRGKGIAVFGLLLDADQEFSAKFRLQAEGRFQNGSSCGPVDSGTICRSAENSPLTALRVTVVPV